MFLREYVKQAKTVYFSKSTLKKTVDLVRFLLVLRVNAKSRRILTAAISYGELDNENNVAVEELKSVKGYERRQIQWDSQSSLLCNQLRTQEKRT